MGYLSLITIYVHTRMFNKKDSKRWFLTYRLEHVLFRDEFLFLCPILFRDVFLFVCLIFQTILVHHPLITFLSLDQAKNCIIKNLDLSQTRAQLNSKVKGSLQNWNINFHRICPFMITLMISKYFVSCLII